MCPIGTEETSKEQYPQHHQGPSTFAISSADESSGVRAIDETYLHSWRLARTKHAPKVISSSEIQNRPYRLKLLQGKLRQTIMKLLALRRTLRITDSSEFKSLHSPRLMPNEVFHVEDPDPS